jgi:hypothetical protein
MPSPVVPRGAVDAPNDSIDIDVERAPAGYATGDHGMIPVDGDLNTDEGARLTANRFGHEGVGDGIA